MYPRQLEHLARQHARELRGSARTRTASTARGTKKPLRSKTGWALVSLGLRIAASGNR
jgi:hypothetical protein